MKLILFILLPVFLSGQIIEERIDSIFRAALSESLIPMDVLLGKIDSVVRAIDRGEPPIPPEEPAPVETKGFVWVDVNSNVLGKVGGSITLPSQVSIQTFGVIGPVTFRLTGPINITKEEGSSPYALFGDIGVRPIVRLFPKGSYQLTASYSGGVLNASFEVK